MWGDNRNTVTSAAWPAPTGRPDPDVWFELEVAPVVNDADLRDRRRATAPDPAVAGDAADVHAGGGERRAGHRAGRGRHGHASGRRLVRLRLSPDARRSGDRHVRARRTSTPATAGRSRSRRWSRPISCTTPARRPTTITNNASVSGRRKRSRSDRTTLRARTTERRSRCADLAIDSFTVARTRRRSSSSAGVRT